MDEKKRYAMRAWIWGIVLSCSVIYAVKALLGDGLSIEWIVYIIVFVWRFVVNIKKCRVFNDYPKSNEYKSKKVVQIVKENDYNPCSYTTPLPKKEENKKEEKYKHNSSYGRTLDISSTPKNKSNVGKNVVTAGFIVGYTGLRTIYSLTKPYMGGKKRRQRRRRRW